MLFNEAVSTANKMRR